MSVTGVSVNPYHTVFQGNALKQARDLALPNQFIDHFVQQHSELTSPYPLVGDAVAKSRISGAVNVDNGSLFAAQSFEGTPNSGKSGNYRTT